MVLILPLICTVTNTQLLGFCYSPYHENGRIEIAA